MILCLLLILIAYVVPCYFFWIIFHYYVVHLFLKFHDLRLISSFLEDYVIFLKIQIFGAIFDIWCFARVSPGLRSSNKSSLPVVRVLLDPRSSDRPILKRPYFIFFAHFLLFLFSFVFLRDFLHISSPYSSNNITPRSITYLFPDFLCQTSY